MIYSRINIWLLLACYIVSIEASSQVGINTTDPQTTLDISGANSALNSPGSLISNDGILIPRVTDDMTTTSTNGVTEGQLVYSVNTNSKGFYYWDGTNWVPFLSSSSNSCYFPENATVESLDCPSPCTLPNTLADVYDLLITDPTFTFNRIFSLPSASSYSGRCLHIIISRETSFSTYTVNNTIAGSQGISASDYDLAVFYSDGTNWYLTDKR